MDPERPAVRLPQLRLRYQAQAQAHAQEGDQSNDSDDQADYFGAHASSTTPDKPDKKRPRYLSDIDRSVIIQRLEKGEKQADLAREFGVTRAAVCHINKNKHEMLTRFDAFARSAHGRVLIENYSRPSTEFECVTEVRTATATVLMTRIKDHTTSPANYRAAANRLIRVLLEEALVSVGSATLAADLPSYEGVAQLTLESVPCVVALNREGSIMLDIFKEMEPETATGSISDSISGADPYDETSASTWQLMCVDLPETIASNSVLLLVPEYTTAGFACAAIAELRARGVQPSSICIVCVSCAIDAVRETAQYQPDVRIITASIEKQSQGAVPPHGVFFSRYLASSQAVAS